MGGQLLNSFRQGNRTEYLATYLLSALGIAVKVPREEDVGIDFHCNLASVFEGGLLRFYAPYNVQIKSSSGGGEKIVYGGLKDGKCMIQEVRWLLIQKTPFFIAIVDKKKGMLRLYSTATRWFAKWSEKIPFEIIFRADTPESNIHIGNGIKTSLDLNAVPEEHRASVEPISWELPLGQPILTLDSEQAEDPCYVLNSRGNLKDYIYLDEKNSVFAGMGLQAFYWPLLIVPNQTLMVQGISVGWGMKTHHVLQNQMKVFAPLVASLQRTYLEAGDFESAGKFDQLLSLIPATDEYQMVRQMIQDSTNMISQKAGLGVVSLSAGEIVVSPTISGA